MSYDYEEVLKLRNELEEYASYEGTELGEVCNAIISVSGNLDYVSEGFAVAVVSEMKDQLANFKENFEWEEREETVTRKYRDLEYKY
jgi:hypothetical protein